MARRTADAQDEAKRRRNLQPLARLIPYLKRHKGMVVGAVIFLANWINVQGESRRKRVEG